jgi:hypothetical protein
MKNLFAISAATAGSLLVAFLAFDSNADTSRGGIPHSPASGVHSNRIFSADSGTSDLGLGMFRLPASAQTGFASGETRTAMLIDSVRKAALSGDAGVWEQVANNELPLLIKSDPLAAAGLAQSLAPGPVRQQILRQVAHGWADQNSMAALGWAAGLSDAVERNSALADVCVQISQSDPAAAISAASQYGLQDEGARFENIVQQWASQDFTAAYGWVSQLPAGAERDGSMTRLALVVAQVSPTDAANLVANEISPGTVQIEAAISVLHEWGLQDFAAASAWASQFPSGLMADRAKQELASVSAYRNALGD